jgi:hypothetical protein
MAESRVSSIRMTAVRLERLGRIAAGNPNLSPESSFSRKNKCTTAPERQLSGTARPDVA